ncbi:hypothetical protein U9M48_033089 [Paspalum notatum var. saurae]|uniref:Uncharacterized protein n=1 Tax=Paspalum notatum var. saurae TaxID=547442 RepID=A0AAQ3U6L1_PASNO
MVRAAGETPSSPLWRRAYTRQAPTSLRRFEGCFDGLKGFFGGDRMRRALAEALVPFYFYQLMAGRLALEIDYNGEAVLFVEADAPDAAVDECGDFAPTTLELRPLTPTAVAPCALVTSRPSVSRLKSSE